MFVAIRELVTALRSCACSRSHAVTDGTDAQANGSVRLEEGLSPLQGWRPTPTPLTASAKAYVNALNSLFVRREKAPPPAQLASGIS